MENQEKVHKRRVRYSGTHPRSYKEKYKEHNPEKYADTIEKVIRKGSTPAGMHISIMVNEILDFLQIKPGQVGLDATLGYGGHTKAMLQKLEGSGHIYALDVDPIESAKTKERLASQGFGEDILTVRLQNFADIDQVVKDTGRKLDFILADLGVSSMQIDNPERGFSFRADAALDMRMDNRENEQRANSKEQILTAAQLIEALSVSELAHILRDYGDVKKANILARAIKNAAPKTTFELRDLIHNPKDVAPVFQALRIAVNDEMGEVERAMAAVPDLLVAGGKCVCVTFHSLEDRIVKNIFRKWTAAPGDPRLPVLQDAPFRLIKTVLPSDEEVANNPRARSAHMRGVIKNGGADEAEC